MAKVRDVYAAFYLYRRMTQKWEDWPAFKDGIIDEKGKIIKKNADWTLIDRMIHSIRSKLEIFIPHMVLKLMLSKLLIMKESTENKRPLCSDILYEHERKESSKEIDDIENKIKQLLSEHNIDFDDII